MPVYLSPSLQKALLLLITLCFSRHCDAPKQSSLFQLFIFDAVSCRCILLCAFYDFRLFAFDWASYNTITICPGSNFYASCLSKAHFRAFTNCLLSFLCTHPLLLFFAKIYWHINTVIIMVLYCRAIIALRWYNISQNITFSCTGIHLSALSLSVYHSDTMTMHHLRGIHNKFHHHRHTLLIW